MSPLTQATLPSLKTHQQITIYKFNKVPPAYPPKAAKVGPLADARGELRKDTRGEVKEHRMVRGGIT